ncbi:uncharacterized protein LOC110881816 [Helianthus annuus]|uniref:uncharacterized protein LOC110881816 n=1 Tax=Helianthus annuus TaxID=4232 RepID=UPI000B8F08B6|nr:uncharacterized protein LOC110881816 [Helianthus annuus]
MTSGKELTLTNVLYVTEIRKNLMSGWMLNKFGSRLVFESDNFVLSRRGMLVGKSYTLNVGYVRSKENIADPLTKGLSKDKVYKSSRGMGLKPIEEENMRET